MQTTHAPLLSTAHKTLTPSSGTTLYVNYSQKKLILEVAFIDGDVYHYYEVSKGVWEDYKAAIEAGESSGKFVNFKIKPFYKYKKVK